MKSKYIAEKEKLIIDSGSTINFINSAQIILCQQYEDVIIFRMADHTSLEIKFDIEDLTKLLSESPFIRINDDFLINLKFLEYIPETESEYIEMTHNYKVPVSEACKNVIIEALENMKSF